MVDAWRGVGLAEAPPLAISSPEETFGVGGIGNLEIGGIPVKFLAGPVSDIAKVIRFGERAGVGEVAGRGGTGFAGVNPFLVVPSRRRNPGLGRLEVLEPCFR